MKPSVVRSPSSVVRRARRPKPSLFSCAIARVMDQLVNVRRYYITSENDDTRLLVTTHWLRSIAEDVTLLAAAPDAEARQKNHTNLQFSLATLAAFTLLWLTPKQSYAAAIKKIAAERERQRALFSGQRISFDVASPIPDNRRKFRVLAEEYGEVAHAIDQIENHGMAPGNLNVELTHVAAVCVAWLEALEVSGPQSVVSGKGGAR